ncbi:Ramosa 1 enhancer locus 2 protein, putative [Medicago truncatula]|uniref:Ramosa 1 enhancer locus 2 protein, putative n=1 Tax=Medicago truncatula TaxID=3880 RepID=A0A072U008_MEDTR|nr:Ramosa 1 enhancer locus 2 protein, putative [Medicago truncatula]
MSQYCYSNIELHFHFILMLIYKLERKTGLYIDMEHFEDMILKRKWDEAKNYLSGFAKVETTITQSKYILSLENKNILRHWTFFVYFISNNRTKASNILMKDLKVFRSKSEELFKDLTHLLTINNIREHPLLSTYQDANSG